MSTEIEQRVVEMRFDNKHFEKNVGQTMSTLEKLKAKLNLSGASKGLENLNTASNKVNMNGLANAVETVGSRFSVMEVIGVTALANITNSAVNAGKRIAAALTIDPVRSGFQEYETQINATKSILANVQHKGKDINDVNKALEELNKYADQTIYNFTEMTKNIGYFTNAGVDLDVSVAAIKGFSNAAAIAGTDSTRAAGAMYQLSQALNAGYMTIQDWNSLTQANINGDRFQEALKTTARVHGIAIDEMIEKEGTLKLTLKDGWLTSDIITETLNHYTLSRKTMTKAEQEAAEAQMLSNGYTKEQIDQLFDLGTAATSAATEVTSFTQLWGVMQEAAQSGWSQTWKLIVGDLDQAKKLFGPIADFFTGPNGIITRMSDARNNLLKGALSFNPFSAMLDKLENSGIGKVVKKVNGITRSLEEYQKVVKNVWRGNYNNRGDNPDRFDLLEKAGWNPHVVQTLVNKGAKYKLTVEDIEKAEKKWGLTTTETVKTVEKLSDEQLRNAGLTEDEIEMYRELEKQSKKTGKSIEEIVESMNKKDGRTLLIESFQNIGHSIAKIFNAIGEAWNDAFGIKPVQLYNFIAGLNEFTSHLRMSDKTAENLTRTLKGVFAIVDLISMVIGGGLKIAFTILKTVLGMFNLDILQFTAILGDAIVAFRDWVEAHNPLVTIIKAIVPLVIKMGKAIGNLAKKMWELPAVQKAVEKITNWFKKLGNIKLSNITSALKSLGKTVKRVLSNINDHFGGVPGDILSGLANGLKNGASKVINGIITLAKNLINKFEEILGIHSPSKVFFAIGGFIIAGLIGGLLSGSTDIGDTMKSIAGKVSEFFEETDWGKIFSKIFTGGMSIGLLMVAKNLSDSLKNFSSLAGGLGSMFDGIGEMTSAFAENAKRISKSIAYTVKSFGKVLKGIAFKKTAEGIKELALSLLMIAGALVLLTLVDTKKMWHAVGALTVMALVLAGLSAAVTMINKQMESGITFEKGKGLQIKGFRNTLLTLATAILTMAVVMKMIGKMDPEQYKQGARGLTDVVVMLGGLMSAYGLLVKGDAARNMDDAAVMMKKMATALLIMAIVVKLVGGMDRGELIQGGLAVLAFSAMIAGLMWATKLLTGSKNVDKIGKSISKIASALLMMVIVAKIAGSMDQTELIQGGFAILAFSGIIVGLMAATKLISGSTNVDKIGGAIFKISAALLMMVMVAKIAGSMDTGDLIKGTLAITAFAGIIVGLMAATKLIHGSKNVGKIGLTILSLSLALGILAATSVVLSLIDLAGLAKGVAAVTVLGAIVAGMVYVSKFGKDVKGTFIGIAIAIGVMAASLAVLSFIDPKKLIGPTIAIGILMGMFALITKCSKNVTDSWKTIAAMAGVIVVLGHVLGKLAKLPIENVIGSAVGLSVLMGTLAGVLFIISKMGAIGKDAFIGIGALAALCVPLLALAGILYLMQDIKNVSENAMALAGLMTVMSIVLLATAGVGAIYTATAGIAATGLLGMVALIGTLYLLMGVLAIMSNVENAISNLDALTSFLKTLTGILVILAIVGPFALIGVSALTGLTVLMGAIGVFAVAVGALMEKFPALQSFLNTGLSVLIQVAGGIGQMIGAFVSGVMTQVATSLPIIGLMLSQFMINAMPFILGAQLVNKNTLIGVGILAAAILALTAADLIEGVTSFLSGGESFSTLGTELSKFMTNALPFVAIANTIKPGVLDGVKSLAQAILIITSANLLEGLNKLLGGESSLESFGTQLTHLGTGLNNFIKAVGPVSDEQITTAKNAASIIKTLASAAKEIPNTGGLLGSLVGENDMGPWATQLPLLATGIVGFTNIITESKIGEDAIKVAETAAKVITTLASAAQEIPNTGGLLADLIGDNDLATFASGLPLVGKGIVGFIQAMTNANITEDQANVANTAAKIIKTLAGVSKDIPNTGGMLAALIGDNDLKTFASGLPDVGKGIAGFCSKLSGLNDAKVKSVNAATEMLKSIVNLGKLDLGKYKSNLSSFGTTLETFGTNIGTFATTMTNTGATNITSAYSGVSTLLNMAEQVSETDTTPLKTFGETLKNFAVEGVKNFVNTFTNKTIKEEAAAGATKLVNKVIDVFESDQTLEDTRKAAKKIGREAAEHFCTNTIKESAFASGEDLAVGFANGIKSENSKTAVASAAWIIGNKGLGGLKTSIDSNSPSKEAMKIGNYFGQGFVVGIQNYGNKVYNTASNVGDDAKNGLTRAISRISSVIDSNIDTQPTIRPVLDLSDVESGAGYLNTMFNNSPSIGVMSNLRAISSSMETKRQNGINSDVVTAIDDLRKDLGNIGGTTNNYNVNGVSYADTDNDINNAVKTLVRAAVVERRI